MPSRPMQIPMHRQARSCGVLAVVVLAGLSAGADGHRDRDPAPHSSLTYHLAAEFNGSPWGEWTVEQGPEIALARAPGQEEIDLLVGSALGGFAAEPNEGGFLVEVTDLSAELKPGFQRASPYNSGTAVIDSLRLELHEGEAHEEVAGHATRHHVLTAHLWWRHVHEDGTETPVTEIGTADLWFARDLPFSWLPFAVAPAQSTMAFPLSYNWPEIPAAAIREHGPALEAFGLLLRARVVDEMRPENAPDSPSELVGTDYTRSVLVSDIQPMSGAPAAGSSLELPRITRDRMNALTLAGALLRECGVLAAGANTPATADPHGTFEFITSGPREFMGGGNGALFNLGSQRQGGYPIVMGSVNGSRIDCTALVLPGDEPRSGSFPLVPFTTASASGASADDGSAVAVQALIEDGVVHRMIVLEDGEVRLSDVGKGRVAGEIDGQGWGLELDPAYPRSLLSDLGLRASFEAVSAEGGPNDG